MAEAKPHIQFIDLAKGFCILLVILFHVDSYAFDGTWIGNFLRSFRMPLYYMLSGIFISFSCGYFNFFLKKIQRLIIPFLFFYVLGMLAGVLYLCKWQGGWSAVTACSLKGFFAFNMPIWFLISLFTTYMFYMAISALCRGKENLISVLCFGVGILGYFLSKQHIALPCYLDTSCTCLPFVVCGNVMRKNLHLLNAESRQSALVKSAIYWIITIGSVHGANDFSCNSIAGNIYTLYIPGLAGACGVLYLAKAIDHIPFINYIGRYSIVLLGTHYIFLTFLRKLMPRFGLSHLWLDVTMFIVTIALCAIAVKILVKFTPHLVAQKDVFKVREK